MDFLACTASHYDATAAVSLTASNLVSVPVRSAFMLSAIVSRNDLGPCADGAVEKSKDNDLPARVFICTSHHYSYSTQSGDKVKCGNAPEVEFLNTTSGHIQKS